MFSLANRRTRVVCKRRSMGVGAGVSVLLKRCLYDKPHCSGLGANGPLEWSIRGLLAHLSWEIHWAIACGSFSDTIGLVNGLKLIAAFDWPMFLNEELDSTLKEAMDTLCSTAEELRYAIATLERCGLEHNSREWVMEAYRTLEERDHFVRLSKENLETVEDYINLANYWRQIEQNIPWSIEILEQWIEKCTPKDWDNVKAWADLYRLCSDNITILLADLVNYYLENKDPKNLYRLMMLWLRIEGLSLEVYQDLKKVAQRLDCLNPCQEQIRMFVRSEVDELIAIYFEEEEWERAIALAQEIELPLEMQLAIAQAVRRDRPEEAIALYDQLVHSYILKKTRPNYQTTAQYAALIRDIYLSVLNKPSQWQEYIDGLRQQYLRYRALQEDLQKL